MNFKKKMSKKKVQIFFKKIKLDKFIRVDKKYIKNSVLFIQTKCSKYFKLFKEINEIGGFIFNLWQNFFKLILNIDKKYINDLKEKYINSIKEKWGLSVFRDIFYVDDYSNNLAPKCGKDHLKNVLFCLLGIKITRKKLCRNV